jgi:hypothetical protein
MCETIDDIPKKKKGFLDKLHLGSKEEETFTAESCFVQTKYGAGTYKFPIERVKDKQEYIKRKIRSKFAPAPNDINKLNESSYHCCIDIEEDLINYTDEIFKPFIDSGFKVVNLTKECNAIDMSDCEIYFISWRNAFKHKEIE